MTAAFTGWGKNQRQWKCNVCSTTAKDKHKLLTVDEVCKTCGVKVKVVSPKELRGLQADWVIKGFLEE